MNIIRFDPFVGIDSVMDNHSRVDRSGWSRPLTPYDGLTAGTSCPAMDITESDREFRLSIDLPGVSKDNIDIQVHGRKLSVTATRPVDYGNDARLMRMERFSGHWQRTIELPDAAGDDLRATFDNGVLDIVVSKRPEAVPRSIKIR